jgi:PadR family transcriptional regulator
MMARQPSAKALSIVAVMLRDPRSSHRGLALCAAAGIPAGASYPLLSELEEIGWVESGWDSRRPGEDEERPRRRLYRLTALGESDAEADLKDNPERADKRPRIGWHPRLAGAAATSISAGGGTRTPDTRIMIPLL